MDELHSLRCMLYVERNPVRAGIVDRSEDYRWSSAKAHVTGRDDDGLIDADAWTLRYPPPVWLSMLREGEDPAVTDRLRDLTSIGLPVMEEGSLSLHEKLLGRRLRRGKPGRPPGEEKPGQSPVCQHASE